MKKVLSIIIVSFNTKKLTLQCIDSLSRFSPRFSYEVIVVDNGSSDGSVEGLRKLKEVKLVENQTNLGFSKANNIGMMRAQGDYILLLNSDTQVTKNAIETLLNFAQLDSQTGIVGARLLNPDGTIQDSCFRLPTIIRAMKQYWLFQKGVLNKYAPKGDDPVAVEAVVGAAFLITPQARKKIGTLDEKYFMYFEDLDYCRKARDAGLKVYYVPGSEIVHYHGASGKGRVNKLLIESSKRYLGTVNYYLYTSILWSGQKLRKLLNINVY